MPDQSNTTVGEWTGDDIVSQLRSEGVDVHWGGRDGLFHRAADEIERLRHREARLLEVIRCYNSDDALFDNEKVVRDVI